MAGIEEIPHGTIPGSHRALRRGAARARPDLLCNLGLALLARGDKQAAFDRFHDVLAVAENHSRTRAAMRRLGVRSAPVLPFLERSNPVNVVLGRLRHWSRR